MGVGGGYYPDTKITDRDGDYLAINADGSLNVAGVVGTSTNAPKYLNITSASSARTVTGNTGSLAFTGTPRFVAITINITAVSGTTPTVQWFAQTTDANGVLVDLFPRIAAAAPTATTQIRFMFGPDCPSIAHTLPTAAAVVSLASAPCVFNPTGSILLGWIIGGTTPSVTFQYGIQQLY